MDNATFEFEFGDWVQCRAIPGRGEFHGVVTFAGLNANNRPFYHVRDEFGQYFHRTSREMVALSEYRHPTAAEIEEGDQANGH
jgi:hypothetical protein